MLIAVKLPPMPLARPLKPGLVTRYRAESEWNGRSGSATYRYGLVFTVAKYKGERPEFVDVGVRMENLAMTQNGESVPRVKLAGAFMLQMQPSGPPMGLFLAGKAAALGLPLVAWYLPPAVAREFEVPEMPIDSNVTATGTGRLIAMGGGYVKVFYDLGIGPSGVPLADRAMKFRATSTIHLRTGVLEAVEGSVVEPGGNLTFRIVR